MTPVEELRVRLKNSLLASESDHQQFAVKAGISGPTLENFLSPLRNPREKTISRIEAEMRRRGWIGNESSDVFPGRPPDDLEANRLDLFAKNDSLTDREKVFLTYCILHGYGNEDMKFQLLKKLLPDTFPAL